MSNSSGSATDATETAAQRLRHIVAAATVDSGLRDRLLADPRAVLAEAGLTLPPLPPLRAGGLAPAR